MKLKEQSTLSVYKQNNFENDATDKLKTRVTEIQ